jgi:hypothetical protein
MMHDTVLLQYVYKTTDMGYDGIQSELNYVQSPLLKDKLSAQQEEYRKLRSEAETLLESRGELPKGIGPITKASAELMSTGKMMVDRTDSKIAEMTIKGNQMGINKTIKHLHDYSGQDTAIRGLTEKLLATEETNAEQLKRFL